MPEPVQLTESYDIKLGGGSWYESYFDCAFVTPVEVIVGQSNRGRSNSQKQYRWFAQARVLTSAFLSGQAEKLPVLLQLPKSDLSVRALPSDAGDEQYLSACRDDARLLAERAVAVLGAVKTDPKKK